MLLILPLWNSYNIEKPIVFPYDHEVMHYAASLRNKTELNRDSAQDPRPIGEIMAQYLNNERIHEMVDQDRSAIWSKRYVYYLEIQLKI